MKGLGATVLHGLRHDVATLARRFTGRPGTQALAGTGEYVPAFDKAMPTRSADYGPGVEDPRSAKPGSTDPEVGAGGS
jgi:hypothetical protein